MKRVPFYFGFLACLLLAASVAAVSKARSDGGAKNGEADKYQVNIDNFSFGPADLTVPAGTTVTWTNHDDVPHNVISTQKLFASPVLDTDETFSYTFTKPGIYPYYCSIHPRMVAKVVMQ